MMCPKKLLIMHIEPDIEPDIEPNIEPNIEPDIELYMCMSVCLFVCHRFFYDVIGRKSGTSHDVARRRTT